MERLIKLSLLAALSGLALTLVGSARNSVVPPHSDDARQAALAVAEQLLPEDRDKWEECATGNPLWLVQISMLPPGR